MREIHADGEKRGVSGPRLQAFGLPSASICSLRILRLILGFRSAFLCDGMKSWSNRRWANREELVNVPGGTRECLQRARVAEGPKVR